MEFAEYSPKESYLRAATACPEVAVGDVPTNQARIAALYSQACEQDVSLVTFPELSVTGYTLGDLVNQTNLLDNAERGLSNLAAVTEGQPTAMVVGLPLRVGNGLFNCAAVLSNGKIRGIVPKSNLPSYNEFYENRWFETWDQPNTAITIGDQEVPFGNDMLFDIDGAKLGVEICEDLWVANAPSNDLAAKGAAVIANPSASPEQVGKSDYRRMLVTTQSAKTLTGYVYAGCDASESTGEVVMSGHQVIANNGQIIAERPSFSSEGLTIADIDIDHIMFDRRKQHAANTLAGLIVPTEVVRQQEDLRVHIERNPFLPEESEEKRRERLESVLQIQAHGLAMRMIATKQERLVLGLSGGLDSTLALIVAMRAAKILQRDPHEMIHTLTMPGPASSSGTQDGAQLLAKQLDVQNKVIPISSMVHAELESLEHDTVTQDITYENVQARARTSILFNYGNNANALVLGTGDLSEIAAGWCTYNADQQSHYHVNGSVPKTMVKELVLYAANSPEFIAAQKTLRIIANNVVSPELVSAGDDEISQSTDDIIGPIELRDFFMGNLVRWGDKPSKIRFLAKQAFSGTPEGEDVDKWLGIFLERFTHSQFKRNTSPDSPKVGSVSLSPRGDWRAPADLHNSAVWQ